MYCKVLIYYLSLQAYKKQVTVIRQKDNDDKNNILFL